MYVGLLPEADSEVIVHRLVIQEVFLDHVAPVSQAKHEVAESVMRVHLHDVPQDRTPADFDQRLGTEFRLFAKTRAQPAA